MKAEETRDSLPSSLQLVVAMSIRLNGRPLVKGMVFSTALMVVLHAGGAYIPRGNYHGSSWRRDDDLVAAGRIWCWCRSKLYSLSMFPGRISFDR